MHVADAVHQLLDDLHDVVLHVVVLLGEVVAYQLAVCHLQYQHELLVFECVNQVNQLLVAQLVQCLNLSQRVCTILLLDHFCRIFMILKTNMYLGRVVPNQADLSSTQENIVKEK